MLDKNLITRKLGFIGEYVLELEPIVNLKEEEIITDKLKVHTTERLFQLIVDAMIDINTHIIQEKILPPPDDLQSTFISLGGAGILPEDFAKKLALVVGLRNAVVHKYETMSIKRFVHELKANFNDFKKYSIIIGSLADK